MTWLINNWHWVIIMWLLLIAVFCWFWYLLMNGATHYPDIHDVCLEREHVFREKGLWYWRQSCGHKQGPYLDAASAYRAKISYWQYKAGGLRHRKQLKEAEYGRTNQRFWDRLLNYLTESSRFVEKYRESKHISNERKSFPESAERKIKAKKKRKRKIAYQSRRINMMRAK